MIYNGEAAKSKLRTKELARSYGPKKKSDGAWIGASRWAWQQKTAEGREGQGCATRAALWQPLTEGDLVPVAGENGRARSGEDQVLPSRAEIH